MNRITGSRYDEVKSRRKENKKKYNLSEIKEITNLRRRKTNVKELCFDNRFQVSCLYYGLLFLKGLLVG